MKTMHIHIKVDNLQQNIQFYSALLNSKPTFVKEDYVKWMLEDPKINLAISTSGNKVGIEHLGIQVESKDELKSVYGNLQNAKSTIREQGETTCCYAKSEKSWVADPQGIEWEVFHTYGESTFYGDRDIPAETKTEKCC